MTDHTVTLALHEVPDDILRRELAKAERYAQNPSWLNVLWPARAEAIRAELTSRSQGTNLEHSEGADRA